MNAADAASSHPGARKRMNVSKELPWLVRYGAKRARRFWRLPDKGATHIFADLEGIRPDRRAKPRHQFRRRHAERGDGILEHPCRESPPAGVSNADMRAGSVAKQHRQTIGNQDRTGPVECGAYRRVSSRSGTAGRDSCG